MEIKIATAASEAEQPPLVLLQAERVEVQSRLDKQREISNRLNDTAKVEQQAQTELRSVTDREAEALLEWAKSGGEGNPPDLLHEERTVAAEKVRIASAHFLAARVASEKFAAERKADDARMQEILAEIEKDALEALVAEHARICDELRGALRRRVEFSVSERALREFLRNLASNLPDQVPGNHERKHAIMLAVGRMNDVMPTSKEVIDLDPSDELIDSTRRGWRVLYHTLMNRGAK